MSHSSIQCKLQCDKTLSCGHKCAEICFRRCSCPCLEEGPLPPTATGTGSSSPKKAREKEQAPILLNTEQHTDLVHRYYKFASGGAKQDDKRLAEEARREAREQQLKHMDEAASRALFGETSPRPIPTTSKLVADGDGAFRTKYTQLYSNASATGAKTDNCDSSLI